MRLLFEMDDHDYDPQGRVFARHSARAIAIRDGKVAMVYSRKFDYYKFPGGGMEPGESPLTAMVREAAEEAGLRVDPASALPYGYVHRVSPSDHPDADIFIQDNFYFLCGSWEHTCQDLDDYEAQEGFTPLWVAPSVAIEVNRHHDHGPSDQVMLEREAKVLELLVAEGYL